MVTIFHYANSCELFLTLFTEPEDQQSRISELNKEMEAYKTQLEEIEEQMRQAEELNETKIEKAQVVRP